LGGNLQRKRQWVMAQNNELSEIMRQFGAPGSDPAS
jgi:hypothetical protein